VSPKAKTQARSSPPKARRPKERPRLAGVLVPVLTPFKADLRPDAARLARHCRWLLSQGCAGLAPFGTTSEGNSLSVEEREDLLERLIADKIDPAVLMPGTGCCSLTDTARLSKLAARRGCGGVLMLPPFYYKAVSDDGLYRHFAEVIERVGDDRLRVYLYHIPPISQVGIGPRLIERLLAAYPKAIAGIKDSSGDWGNTQTVLGAFAKSGFDVFVGSERFLLANMRHGGVGCITAVGNVNPAAIARLHREWQSPEAEWLQREINVTRGAVERHAVIPALKEIVARFTGDPAWRTVRPPLAPLSSADADALLADLQQRDFRMPGLGG
jgi:4-hydroxy-tetrahydrodipicolinate synthase